MKIWTNYTFNSNRFSWFSCFSNDLECCKCPRWDFTAQMVWCSGSRTFMSRGSLLSLTDEYQRQSLSTTLRWSLAQWRWHFTEKLKGNMVICRSADRIRGQTEVGKPWSKRMQTSFISHSTIESFTFAASIREISQLGSAFTNLRWIKLAHICIQVKAYAKAMQSIQWGNVLIINRFHVTLRIISPESCKQC